VFHTSLSDAGLAKSFLECQTGKVHCLPLQGRLSFPDGITRMYFAEFLASSGPGCSWCCEALASFSLKYTSFSWGNWVKGSVCIILEICLSDLMAPSGKICEIVIAEVERGRGSKVDASARFT